MVVDDDATISVTSTNAYGATATTVLGAFSGEPESRRRLLDSWFAATPATAPT